MTDAEQRFLAALSLSDMKGALIEASMKSSDARDHNEVANIYGAALAAGKTLTIVAVLIHIPSIFPTIASSFEAFVEENPVFLPYFVNMQAAWEESE